MIIFVSHIKPPCFLSINRPKRTVFDVKLPFNERVYNKLSKEFHNNAPDKVQNI